MSALDIVLMCVCAALIIWNVLMHYAMMSILEEREAWYTPIKPVDFDILDAEVVDKWK